MVESILLLLGVAFLVMIERKLLGGLQLRTRPLYCGVFGLLQTVIDGLKLLTKGVLLFGCGVCRVLFLLLSCSSYMVSYIELIIILSGLLYCFLYISINSNNLYSLLRSYRALVLMISYDVLLLLLLLNCDSVL
jgi:NADH:ubiquinone oxidoreductase subunit H